jgi:galactonate dehydratase
MAHLQAMPCCPHNWHGGLSTMANAALVAAIPNRLLLELNQTYSPFKEELFEDPLVVRNGYLDLQRRLGFGMKVKTGVAAKFPYIPGNYWKPNPKLAA